MTRLVRTVEDDIPAVLLAFMVCLLSADVVGRYAFDHPIRWAAEIAQICFIWLVYLASIGVMRRRRHVTIDILHQHVSGRYRAILDAVTALVVGTVLTMLTWQASLFVATTHFTDLPATGLSRRYVGAAVLVAAAGMLFHATLQLVQALRGVAGRSYSGDRETFGEHDELELGIGAAERGTVSS
ncbi:TRAP transporter small permease [Ornithinimicrobium cavernae]|uniref:TRAP transporter small permease n=1 Tax=Ornithinimicrobium cavernae TaxID=2666047 RepID=UPI000D69E2E6|nr:TRAP transporter small permease subunit [Ornithinimicrobium cavernae]